MKQGSVLQSRWLRTSLSLLVAGLMIGSISYIGVHTYKSSHAATAPSIYASPNSGTIANGSILSVTLRANSGSEGVNSVQASLNYDASKLTYNSISEAGSFPLIAATNTSSPGVIRVGRGNNDTPVTGDNAIVTINFKVTGTSGTGTISIDKAYSALVRSSDSTDILANVGSGSYTITSSTSGSTPTVSPIPQPPGGSSSYGTERPVLTLSPASGNLPAGSPLSVAVRLHSYNYPVSTVESVVTYPAAQLQYTGLTEGGIYTTKQRTKTDSGSIDIIRAIAGGSAGIEGENTVVTLNFKVIGNSGPVTLAVAAGSAVYDTTGTGQNILDTGGSKGAAYTVGATSSAPIVVAPLTNDAETIKTTSARGNTITTPAQAMSITSGSGNVALTTDRDGLSLAELTGEVKLTPIFSIESLQAGEIQKVEYFLDGELINTAKVSPYTYSFDSKAMRNGIYTMGIKTYLADGSVSTKTDKLLVNNPVNIAYVTRHYLGSILGVFALLIILGGIIFKLVLPRMHHQDTSLSDVEHDALYGFSEPQMDHDPLVAGSPLVVTPVGASGAATPLQPKFSSAALTTDALPLTAQGSQESQRYMANMTAASIPIRNESQPLTSITSPVSPSQGPAPAVAYIHPPATNLVQPTIVQPVLVPRPITVTDEPAFQGPSTASIIQRPASERLLANQPTPSSVTSVSDDVNQSRPQN